LRKVTQTLTEASPDFGNTELSGNSALFFIPSLLPFC